MLRAVSQSGGSSGGSVTSLQLLTGALLLTSSGGTIAISTLGQNINLESTGSGPSGVSSLNGLIGALTLVNAAGVSFTASGTTITPALGAITPTTIVASSNISGATLSGTNTGSATLADASTQPLILSGGASPTAGNLVGLAIEKTGFEEVFLGINKNSTTGEYSASSLYLSTYTSTGLWGIGRGNGAGLIDKADLKNDTSGNVIANRNFTATGTIGGSNFSGSSSGTNTGDQTNITGNAGTATFATTAGTASAVAFSGITGATNTIAAMVVGNGASLAATGTGTIAATTSIALATPRAINGVNFDGTAPITVTAAAGTLTGTTLNSTVVTSSLTSVGAQAQALNMNSHQINNVTDPTNPQDALTLNYFNNNIGNYDSKLDVAYVSLSALPANTYNNGTSGVGATLTGNSNGPLIIDGVTILVGQVGESVLVAAESTSANNGWYSITQQGVVAVSPYILTRRTDSDQPAEIGSGYLTGVVAPNGVTPGANNGKLFISIAAADPFVVGTTNLTFSQVGSTYSADGTTLTLTGSTFSINASYPGQSSITTLGTVATGTWQGSLIVGQYGGTGVNNSGKTITLGGNLITSGAFATTLTATATTSVTLPTTGTLATLAGTETFTNKRITRRLVSTTQSATPTINTDNTDIAEILNLAQAVTSFTTNLSGTPVNGDMLIIRITDNGTARALSFGASFETSTVALPTTTVISTPLDIGLRWNAATSKWRCVAVA